MALLASLLAEGLNAARAPVTMIVPMGGFSHQDKPDGAIEDERLRRVFLEAFRAAAGSDIRVRPVDAHINEPATAEAVLDALTPSLA